MAMRRVRAMLRPGGIFRLWDVAYHFSPDDGFDTRYLLRAASPLRRRQVRNRRSSGYVARGLRTSKSVRDMVEWKTPSRSIWSCRSFRRSR